MRSARLASLAALSIVAFHAAPALAQAPGNCECAAPAAAAPPAPSQGWRGQRFGIGLRVGSMSLAPEGNPEAETHFATGGLQIRYRLNARWELEGAIESAQEEREDGTPGMHQLSSMTVSALFHLRPHRRWDPYLLAGLGATGEVDQDSMQVPDENRHGQFQVGIGLERRFRRFGIAAELRMIALAPAEDASTSPDTREPVMAIPPLEDESAREGVGGGQFTLLGNYYF